MKTLRIALCAALSLLGSSGLFAAPRPGSTVGFNPVTFALTQGTTALITYPDRADGTIGGQPAITKVTIRNQDVFRELVWWTQVLGTKVVKAKIGSKEIIATLADLGVIPETDGWFLAMLNLDGAFYAAKKVDKTHYKFVSLSGILTMVEPVVAGKTSETETYSGTYPDNGTPMQIAMARKGKAVASFVAPDLGLDLKGLEAFSFKVTQSAGHRWPTTSFTSKITSILGVVEPGLASGKISLGKTVQVDPANCTGLMLPNTPPMPVP